MGNAAPFLSTSAGTNTGTSPLQWTHPSQGNMLVVGITVATSSDTVTGITAGGVAMTKIGTSQTGTNVSCSLWQLANPPGGNITIAVTFTGISNVEGMAVSIGNVSAANVNNKGSASSSAVSTSVTTTLENCIVVDIVGAAGAGPTLTVNANQNQRQNASGGTNTLTGMSTRVAGAAGAYAMAWTNGATGPSWVQVVAAFAPSFTQDLTNFQFAKSGNGMSVTEKIR